ncbi:PREDICTED: barttin [Chaetura pelagica]|uniref:barttin n=1 Tax=Chaetura pelagica TaxID=8897 RepID=UPI000523BB6C|nr:PREDICTED: barttin [Chaetura pelagica]
MAEEKTFRYGFIMLGFFLVMTGIFIMSVEKPHIYITFCALGVLLVAVGITWSMCQCYPKITFIPVDTEAKQFLDHKPIMLQEGNTRLVAPCPNHEEKSLLSYEQTQSQVEDSAPLPPTAQPRPRSCSQPAVQARAEVHRELGDAGDLPPEPDPRLDTAAGDCPSRPAPLASLLEDMDTPSLEGSPPGSPVPRCPHPPASTSCSSRSPTSSPAGGEQPGSPRKGTGEEDDLYYGLGEGPDALPDDTDCLFEPEN